MLIKCGAFAFFPTCIYPAVVKRSTGTEICPAVSWKELSELIKHYHLETPSHFSSKSLHLPKEATYLFHWLFSPSLPAPVPGPFHLLLKHATLFKIKVITVFCVLFLSPNNSLFQYNLASHGASRPLFEEDFQDKFKLISNSFVSWCKGPTPEHKRGCVFSSNCCFSLNPHKELFVMLG